jgi:hypothetical protein
MVIKKKRNKKKATTSKTKTSPNLVKFDKGVSL